LSSGPSSTWPAQPERSATTETKSGKRMRASLRGGCGQETHIANEENDLLNRLSNIDYNMPDIAHRLMRKSEGTAAGETQTLIGRDAERARLVALVERERVVAIVGAAGVGKSALARAALPVATVVAPLVAAADVERAGDAPIVVCDDVSAEL